MSDGAERRREGRDAARRHASNASPGRDRDAEPLPEGVIPLRERRTLAEEWESFEKAIHLERAGPVQRQEMRRAFYAGAAALFGNVTGGLDADSEPTELDVQFMQRLVDELEQFSRDMESGRA